MSLSTRPTHSSTAPTRPLAGPLGHRINIPKPSTLNHHTHSTKGSRACSNFWSDRPWAHPGIILAVLPHDLFLVMFETACRDSSITLTPAANGLPCYYQSDPSLPHLGRARLFKQLNYFSVLLSIPEPSLPFSLQLESQRLGEIEWRVVPRDPFARTYLRLAHICVVGREFVEMRWEGGVEERLTDGSWEELWRILECEELMMGRREGRGKEVGLLEGLPRPALEAARVRAERLIGKKGDEEGNLEEVGEKTEVKLVEKDTGAKDRKERDRRMKRERAKEKKKEEREQEEKRQVEKRKRRPKL